MGLPSLFNFRLKYTNQEVFSKSLKAAGFTTYAAGLLGATNPLYANLVASATALKNAVTLVKQKQRTNAAIQLTNAKATIEGTNLQIVGPKIVKNYLRAAARLAGEALTSLKGRKSRVSP